MPSPKPKNRRRKAKKRKGKVTIKEHVKVRSKGTKRANKDTLQRMEARPPADVAPTFRIKIRRK